MASRPWPHASLALGWDHIDRGGQSSGKGDGPQVVLWCLLSVTSRGLGGLSLLRSLTGLNKTFNTTVRLPSVIVLTERGRSWNS